MNNPQPSSEAANHQLHAEVSRIPEHSMGQGVPALPTSTCHSCIIPTDGQTVYSSLVFADNKFFKWSVISCLDCRYLPSLFQVLQGWVHN